MKIVIDARYLAAAHSGIGVYCQHLVEHLSELDDENQYTVLVHSTFDRELLLSDCFEVVRLDARPVSLGTLYGAVDAILDDVQPDVFHSAFPLVPLRWEGPTIVTVHDLQPFTVADFTAKRNPVVRLGYDLFYRWAYQAAFNRADVLLSNSLDTKARISEHFPLAGHRTLHVRMGLDPAYREHLLLSSIERTRSKYRLPDRYIHYVGSTRPNKNLPRMLDAFADYLKESEDAELRFVLVVARDRFFVDCERVLDGRGLRERVLVFDQVSEEELRVIHACSLALFFATESEGFGFPILEAQASGTPVIAGDDGAAPEIAGKGALIVDPRDTAALVEALHTLLAEGEEREDLISRGFANSQAYSWENTARQTLDVYRNMFDPALFGLNRRLTDPSLTATNIGG